MSCNNSQFQETPRIFATKDRRISWTTTCTPPGITFNFMRLPEYSNHPMNVISTPHPYPPAHVIRQSLENQGLGQPPNVESDIYTSSEGPKHTPGNFYSTLPHVAPPHSLETFDPMLNPSKTWNLQPYSLGTSSSPCASKFDLLNTFSFHGPIFHQIPSNSPNMPHTIQQNVCTKAPQRVLDRKTLALSQKHQKRDTSVFSFSCLPQLANSSPSHSFQYPSPHSSINSNIQTKGLNEAQIAFERLVPSLQTVNTSSYGAFLVSLLNEYPDHVSLEHLYEMLYRDDFHKETCILNDHTPGSDHELFEKKLETIQLYNLVVESFKRPKTFQDGLFKNSSLSTINFHELSRKCLAMKIIFGCIEQVKDPSKTLSRNSIYKVYYIICQKLNQRYPEISTRLGLHQHLILGKSKVGILTKLVYPNLVCKRLGRRGQSKTHYIGFTWNESMVNDEIIDLLSLDIIELCKHFKDLSEPVAHTHNPKRFHPSGPNSRNTTHQDFGTTEPVPLPFTTKPLYTFVDSSCTYPDLDCSPRVWKVTNNMAPKQSQWANGIMQKSLKVLLCYGVDLAPLISMFTAGIFSQDINCFSETITHAISVLVGASAPEDTFLHLYLAIMVLVLPVILASDQEVSKASKLQLHASIKQCVLHLETKEGDLAVVDSPSLITFTQVLTKMIHINGMTSTSVRISHRHNVIKELVQYIKLLTNNADDSTGMSAFEDICANAIIKGLNAYKYESSATRRTTMFLKNAKTIRKIANSFKEVLMMATSTMQQMPLFIMEEDVDKDVPYRLFNLSAELFHEITLSYPEISSLPIPIINYMMIHYTNEMQNIIFLEPSKSLSELSEETFKAWWVFSSMFQEYMSVMSEVVSLSSTLFRC
ncbi:hypothetical protein JCM33374_g6624 [Metschnikowia sp. JCM 33374]|nr:hypothetical protein JCM33374_g6624 [Metschnikowia sp. JCM 33374]